MAGRGSDQRVVKEVIRQGGEHRNLSSGVRLGIQLCATSRRGLNVLLLFAQLSAAGIAFAGVTNGAGADVSGWSREGLLLAAPAAASAV
jgi:hypothetical protein